MNTRTEEEKRAGQRFAFFLSPSLLSSFSPFLFFPLLASEALYLALLRFDARNGLRPVLTFLGILGALFALYALSVWLVREVANQRALFFVIVCSAVMFRLTLLPAGLPHDTGWHEILPNLRADLRGESVVYERFQLYDNDIWRYLWDGHTQANGINPYQYAPTDEALNRLAETEVWSSIRDYIGYADTPTIYPPLAQLSFRLSHWLAPGSVLMMKSVIVFFDLLAMLFLALILKELRRPLSLVILYAWNPLVIKVFAGSGHVDSLLVAALAAAAYFIIRQRSTAAAVSIGLAILAKLSPMLLLPFVLKRIGWRHAVTVTGVVLIGYLPFIHVGATMFAGFRRFAQEWQFNAGPFLLVQWIASFALNDAALIARGLCGLLIVIAVAMLFRCDDGGTESFSYYAVLTLGILLLLSPAVMPWYVTWLLPLAIVAGQRAWLYFSLLVCLAFAVMIDERERAWVLGLEYGIMAALLGYELWSPIVRRAAFCQTNQSTTWR